MKRRILFISALLLCFSAFGQVRLPRLISDGMLLQRETPLKIWGWAAPNEAITLNFNKADYKISAD
ncbi:MAG: sialate O-acetylesterase, partial [Candidatus Symbiothrix sp.]|nr:sialate O-acetylesterase [Candidatus Symbiothrix sp.]